MPDGAVEYRVGFLKLLADLRIGLCRHRRVIVGVARYLVTLLPGAFDKAGAALGHLADEEEGAVRAARLESVKKPGGVAARGAVVEGESNELISVGARRYRQSSH